MAKIDPVSLIFVKNLYFRTDYLQDISLNSLFEWLLDKVGKWNPVLEKQLSLPIKQNTKRNENTFICQMHQHE